jgi:hypothetical protein
MVVRLWKNKNLQQLLYSKLQTRKERKEKREKMEAGRMDGIGWI